MKEIIHFKGDDALVYKHIAPFAMSKVVIDHFGNYPIYTSEKREWLVVLEGKKVVAFCSLEFTAPTLNVGNIYCSEEGKNIKRLLTRAVKIWNKADQHKIRVYVKVGEEKHLKSFELEFKRGVSFLVYEKMKSEA